jgi:hypothetical protein
LTAKTIELLGTEADRYESREAKYVRLAVVSMRIVKAVVGGGSTGLPPPLHYLCGKVMRKSSTTRSILLIRLFSSACDKEAFDYCSHISRHTTHVTGSLILL